MKKKLDFFFILCVMLSLAALAVITAFSEKETFSYYENRDLAELPAPEADTILDGSYFSALEAYLADHAALREDLNTLDTAISLSLLHRPVVNDIVIQEDLLLPYLDYEVPDAAVIQQQAEALADNIQSIASAVEGYGGVYCYVAIPGQYSYCQTRYPDYLNNRSDYMALAVTALSDTLLRRGIPFLDLGSVYEALGYPMELSSTVDNHYSAQGAYLAYSQILTYLETLRSSQLKPLVCPEVTFTPVDRYYLGARARRLCNLIRTEEQIYTMTPAEAVSFTRRDNGDTVEAAVYTLPEDPQEPVTYSYYMGGDIALTQIDTGRDALPTVLLYGDSYTNAMECILYLSCDTMYSIDLRHYTDKTVTEFVREVQPDYVICLRDYGVLLSTEGNGGS